jgi:hypothetical protein
MNTKFVAVAALGALSLAAIAPQAAAADNGFYIGAGITKSEFELDGSSESLDDSSFKLIAGFRPLDWLAVEANYIDVGGESFEDDFLGDVNVDSTAITVSALAIAEVGLIDLYARVGMANWKIDVDTSEFGDVSDDGWEPTYGVGIGAHFGSFGIRGEWETFSPNDYDTDISTVSLSFTYTFL